LSVKEKDKKKIGLKLAIFNFLKSYDSKRPCIIWINFEKESLFSFPFFSIFKDEISFIPWIKKRFASAAIKKNILCIDNFDNLSA
jgi:hypothetical protein